MKKHSVPILLMLLFILMGGSYFILRLDNINNFIVIILTLSMMILGPLSIYLLLIRPRSMPKLLAYVWELLI